MQTGVHSYNCMKNGKTCCHSPVAIDCLIFRHVMSFMQVLKASKQDCPDASERNKRLAQRMQNALASSKAVYKSLKQDTLLFRHGSCSYILQAFLQQLRACTIDSPSAEHRSLSTNFLTNPQICRQGAVLTMHSWL